MLYTLIDLDWHNPEDITPIICVTSDPDIVCRQLGLFIKYRESNGTKGHVFQLMAALPNGVFKGLVQSTNLNALISAVRAGF